LPGKIRLRNDLLCVKWELALSLPVEHSLIVTFTAELGVCTLPDETQEDEYKPDEAAHGLDGGGVFTATPGDEVVGGRQRDVLQQQGDRQFVVQRNQRVSLRAIQSHRATYVRRMSDRQMIKS